jgi:hypothetical protein
MARPQRSTNLENDSVSGDKGQEWLVGFFHTGHVRVIAGTAPTRFRQGFEPASSLTLPLVMAKTRI